MTNELPTNHAERISAHYAHAKAKHPHFADTPDYFWNRTFARRELANARRELKIGLIDVDGHNFPNLALMKLSAWHKAQGDAVEMCFPLSRYDRVYASKVFTDDYSQDIDWQPLTDDLRKGGTGYGDYAVTLPEEIEHIMPDYSLYDITDTAYGFMTRGCPRGCPFCIVAAKEGRASRRVADVREFWDGQRNITCLDPNVLACPDWRDVLGQLADTRAVVNFCQGLDLRLMTEDKAQALNRVRTKCLHFAWDGNEDLEPLFRRWRPYFTKHRVNLRVYCLTNYGTSHDWDLHRVETLRELDYDPYVMVYDKKHAPLITTKLQRWCNNKIVFGKVWNFKDYDANK